jgi:aminopeptidase N
MTRTARLCLFSVVSALVGAPSAAPGQDQHYDAHTGRDVRAYAPDTQVDYQHIKLEMVFADLMSRSFRCSETITFRTRGAALERLVVHGIDLDIQAVRDLGGRVLDYSYDDEQLTARFADRLPADSDGGIVIEYTCTKPERGMWFALPDEAYPERPLMIHTQGEADYNRYWFFSHDAPNERCTTEILCTAPKPYGLLSNGRLVERSELDGERYRWHYALEQPHPPYLVSLVLGEFDVVAEDWRGKPVEYWVPPGRAGDVPRTFGQTPKMMTAFSDVLDFEYPYDKYAQSVVYLFQWGGMENTSTTTLYETAVVDAGAPEDDDIEGLIAHELAHQWFGDMITCKTWDHIWLNEGFATFLTHVWYEHEYGEDEYDYRLWGLLHNVAGSDRVGKVGGMVAGYSGIAMDIFSRAGSNPYSKGCSTLHMLRRTLGEDVFWRSMRAYVKRNAWKQAETSDLRHAFEDVSGRNLEQFFGQWVYRGGAPEITVEADWDDERRASRVVLTQTQEMSAAHPAFVADVDVWLVFEGGKIEKHTLHVDQRVSALVVACESEPEQVCVDPRASLLAKYDWDLSTSMLTRIAADGPTIGARLHAVAALSQRDRDAARATLESVLIDADAHWGLRAEAARSLGRMQTPDARELLASALRAPRTLDNLRVRRAAIEALGQYRNDQAAAILLRYARDGASSQIIEAACGALGKQDPTDEIVNTLLADSERASRDDIVQKAAVSALAALGDSRGLAAARKLAAYGSPYRARSTGISALGRLGETLDDKRAVRETLEALLNDPQDKAAGAVAGALGRLGDPEAVAALQQFAASAAPERLRRQARNAIDKLNDKTGSAAVIRDLRDRIRELEDFREDAEQRDHEQHATDGDD